MNTNFPRVGSEPTIPDERAGALPTKRSSHVPNFIVLTFVKSLTPGLGETKIDTLVKVSKLTD